MTGKMPPRIILLICVAILIYFLLSLYHTSRLKEYREAAEKSGNQQDWVQLTTTDGQETEEEETKSSPQTIQLEAQKESPSPQDISQDMPTGEDSRINTLRQQLQTAGEEREKLRLLLDEKIAENKQLSLQANDLHARLSQQQFALQQVNAQLHDKNQALENATTTIAELSDKQEALEQQLRDQKTISRQVDSIKSSLQAKTTGIAKANERIAALSIRAEQTSRDLVAAEKTIARLQLSLAASQSSDTKEDRNGQRTKEELFRSQEENKKLLAEIGSLHTRIDGMKSRLSILETAMKKAELKAEAMLRYGQEQGKKLAPSIDEIKTLKARLAEQQDLLAQARQELDLHKQGKLRLQQQLTAKETEKEKLSGLQEQLQIQSAASDAAESRINQLTEELRNNAEQLNRKETVINELTVKLEEAQAAARAAEEKTDALAAELAAAKEQLGEEQSDMEQLQKRIEQNAAERDQQLAALAENKKQVDELSADLASVNEQMQAFAAENSNFRSTLQEKNTLLAKMQDQLRQAADENRKLKNNQQEIQKKLQQKNSALENTGVKIKKLNQQLEKEKNSLTQAQATVSKLKKTLADADKSKAGRSLVINTQQEKISSLEDLAGQRKRELEQLTAALSQKSSDNQATNRELEETRQKVRSLTERIAELEQETSTLRQAIQDAKLGQEQLKSLQAELEQRKKAFLGLQEEFSTLQSNHAVLQQQYNELMRKATDSDGDGVSDADDACPDTPANASVDTRGCETDSDGDGLADRLDLCPDSPGNAAVNEFGCRPDKPIILADVVFESGTAELSQSAEASLNKTVRILQHYPGKRFEIGGHTDSIGDPEWNLTVSLKRAESVKEYLLSKGIDKGRLEANGYGADYPVADNETPAGRAVNRRVELKFLEE